MSIKTNSEVIRDETGLNKNTAERVGGVLVDIATDLEAKQLEINENTAKETNISHPLVQKAVPSDAVFTDTVYDDTTIQAEVDLNVSEIENVKFEQTLENYIKTWKFKNALDNVRNGIGNASLMVYGDSVAKSYLTDDAFKNLYKTYDFRGLFCSATSSIGAPLFSFNRNGINQGGTIITNQYNEWFSGDVFQLTESPNQVEFEFTNFIDFKNTTDFSVNKTSIVYKQFVGGGTFEVYKTIGEATLLRELIGTIDTNGAEGLVTQEYTFAQNFEDDTKIECVWLSGGSVIIVGALIEDTTKNGIILSFADKGGIQMQDQLVMSTANVSLLLNLIKPDVITWSMKDNDVVNYLGQLNTLFQSVYNVEWLFILPYPDAISSTPEQAQASAYGIRDWAIDNSFDYYDTLQDIPSYQYGLDLGWYEDGTHINYKAKRVLSVRLFENWEILPDYKGSEFDNYGRRKVFTADEDIILQEKSLLQELGTLDIKNYNNKGVLISQGNNFLFNLEAFAPIGVSNFMMRLAFKIPISETFNNIGLIGIRNIAGGNDNGSVSIRLESAQSSLAVTFRTLAGANQQHNSPDAYSYIVANQGNINELILIRNNNNSTFVKLFINGIYFELSAQQLNEVTDIDSGYLKIGAQSSDQQDTDLIVFDTGYRLGDFNKTDVVNYYTKKDAYNWDLDHTFLTNRGLISSNNNSNFRLYGASTWAFQKPTDSFETDSAYAGVNQSMVRNQTYVHNYDNNSNLGNFTLPTVFEVGDFVEIIGYAQGKWRIIQQDFVQIRKESGTLIGTNATTTGISGQIASANRYESVKLRCVYKNEGVSIIWVIESFVGTLIFT